MKQLAENNKLLRLAVIVLWGILAFIGSGSVLLIADSKIDGYYLATFLALVALVIGISCYLYKTTSIRFFNSNKALRRCLIALWSLAAVGAFAIITALLADHKSTREAEEETDNRYHKLKMADNMDWIKPLQGLDVPDTTILGDFQINTDINVYIRFNQPVNGYEVTCRFFPYDDYDYSQWITTGYMIMRLEGNGNVLTLQEDNYYDWQTMKISTERHWHNNDVYEFDYIEPNSTEDYRDSPLGYDTPFQFCDIDFDGEEELLINGGYNWSVYKIVEGTLTSISDKLPFSTRLRSCTEIDPARKTITLSIGWNGCPCSVYVRFVRMDKEDYYLTDIPVLKCDFCVQVVRAELQEYYISTPNIFAIDYIKEEIQDSVFEYRLRDKRLELVKSSLVEEKP